MSQPTSRYIYSSNSNIEQSLVKMKHNGLQYNQWRIAGDIPVNRYKTLSGADAFKLPLRPTLVILRVMPSFIPLIFCQFLFLLNSHLVAVEFLFLSHCL